MYMLDFKFIIIKKILFLFIHNQKWFKQSETEQYYKLLIEILNFG